MSTGQGLYKRRKDAAWWREWRTRVRETQPERYASILARGRVRQARAAQAKCPRNDDHGEGSGCTSGTRSLILRVARGPGVASDA